MSPLQLSTSGLLSAPIKQTEAAQRNTHVMDGSCPWLIKCCPSSFLGQHDPTHSCPPRRMRFCWELGLLEAPGLSSSHSVHPVACSVAQSCPTLCDPVDCSPPGPSVHGILQARRLQWVAISSSRASSRQNVSPVSPALQADSFPLSHRGSPYTLDQIITA